MTLCDPSLGDVARGIDEPSLQLCQRNFLVQLPTARLPFICHFSNLAPRVVIEQDIIAFDDYHSRSGRNTNVKRHGILFRVVETRHPQIFRRIVLIVNWTASQQSDHLDEGLNVKSERRSPSTECFIGICECGQGRFRIVIAIL